MRAGKQQTTEERGGAESEGEGEAFIILPSLHLNSIAQHPWPPAVPLGPVGRNWSTCYYNPTVYIQNIPRPVQPNQLKQMAALPSPGPSKPWTHNPVITFTPTWTNYTPSHTHNSKLHHFTPILKHEYVYILVLVCPYIHYLTLSWFCGGPVVSISSSHEVKAGNMARTGHQFITAHGPFTFLITPRHRVSIWPDA